MSTFGIWKHAVQDVRKCWKLLMTSKWLTVWTLLKWFLSKTTFSTAKFCLSWSINLYFVKCELCSNITCIKCSVSLAGPYSVKGLFLRLRKQTMLLFKKTRNQQNKNGQQQQNNHTLIKVSHFFWKCIAHCISVLLILLLYSKDWKQWCE